MHTKERRLVVVSTRTPKQGISKIAKETTTQPVSGVVSAVESGFNDGEVVWLGWSGQTVPYQENNIPQRIKICSSVEVVTVDLSADEVRDFYTKFCLGILWPLFMCFPDRLNMCRKGLQQEYKAYRHVNRYFATTLFPLLRDDDIVWVHDYQHISLGEELRRLGWYGSLGFFLHTPFPPVEILTLLPQAKDLLQDLTAYQLLGFQTQRDCTNCANAMRAELGGTFNEQI
jgi:trehalose 6-phosphate synthase